MIRKASVLLFALTLMCAALSAETVDEILAKNIEAKGGLEKMKSVTSVKATGKMTMGQGMEAPFTVQKMRPQSVRMDFTIQGMTGTQAYDGETGWMVMPFLGKPDAEKMSEDMLKDVIDEADFDGPMVDYKQKGNQVELLGKEEIEGTAAYKIKVTKKSGDELVVFLDADSYLEIKQVSRKKVQGQEAEIEVAFGDYKEVDGIMMPFSIESRIKGMSTGQSITVDKVELNPKLEEAAFKMPAKKEKEEKPKSD